MTLSLAQSAIALLIDLAERGEIDPWDVQVIEVIDRFLSQLQPLHTVETGRAPYETDLSESGQAFLYASMLVLLKADSLARSDTEAAEEGLLGEAELLAEGLDSNRPLPVNLERRIRRRAVARPPQQRRVTLQELIAQLELMASTVADPKTPRRRRPRPQSRSQAVRTIAQLAHQENLSEIAAAIEQFLLERWDEISQGNDWLDFELLLDLWSNPESGEAIGFVKPEGVSSHSPQGDRVAVFWALLFLSSQSKVELEQEEFYQDLKVRSLAHTSPEEMAELSAIALLD